MNNLKTKQTITDTAQINRIDVHSHISGLGLTSDGQPKENSAGMSGQLSARKAMGIISRIVQQKKIAGKGILLAGPPGTGKTALAIGLANELGPETPFTAVSASEIYSLDLSKTEVLRQCFRKSIGVKITEETDIIEGEVVEIILDKSTDEEKPLRRGKLTLKTTDMESIYDLGEKMVDALSNQKVECGDVITIDKSSGKISRLGRSFSRSQDFDAMGVNTKFINCPKGELQNRRQVTHTVSLHEIDVINSRSQGFLALFAGDTGEIPREVREQIDLKVAAWAEEGKAQIVPGVLFLDEAHTLDIECFSFINRALEGELAPVVVLATNRGVAEIRGADRVSPHGMPLDLLDRLLVVPTFSYGEKEIAAILRKRCDEEGADFEGEAFGLLVKIGAKTSLRYAMQLISVAVLLSQQRKNKMVEIVDIRRGFELFCDSERSAKNLVTDNEGYVFDDNGEEENGAA